MSKKSFLNKGKTLKDYKEFHIKKGQLIRNFWNSLSEEDRRIKVKEKSKKSSNTKMKKYGTCNSLEITRIKYGNEAYNEYKRKLFPTNPGKASKESLEYFSPLLNFLKENKITYYIGAGEKKEYKIYSNKYKRGFMYDLTIITPNKKIIIEYDGAGFHPTKKQFLETPEKVIEASNVTIKEQYTTDQIKKNNSKK